MIPRQAAAALRAAPFALQRVAAPGYDRKDVIRYTSTRRSRVLRQAQERELRACARECGGRATSGCSWVPAFAQDCPGKILVPFRRVRKMDCTRYGRHARAWPAHPRLVFPLQRRGWPARWPAMTMKRSLRRNSCNRITFLGQPCACAGVTMENVLRIRAISP